MSEEKRNEKRREFLKKLGAGAAVVVAGVGFPRNVSATITDTGPYSQQQTTTWDGDGCYWSDPCFSEDLPNDDKPASCECYCVCNCNCAGSCSSCSCYCSCNPYPGNDSSRGSSSGSSTATSNVSSAKMGARMSNNTSSISSSSNNLYTYTH